MNPISSLVYSVEWRVNLLDCSSNTVFSAYYLTKLIRWQRNATLYFDLVIFKLFKNNFLNDCSHRDYFLRPKLSSIIKASANVCVEGQNPFSTSAEDLTRFVILNFGIAG